jgi:hypothetical protein
MPWRLLLPTALAALVIACGSPTPSIGPGSPTPISTPSPVPLVPASVPPGTVRLPTNGAPVGGGCLGVSFDKAILRGDPSDPRLAWLKTPEGRLEVFFPLGFVGRFAPNLEVVHPSGQVVARDGDIIEGGCWTADDGPWVILTDSDG